MAKIQEYSKKHVSAFFVTKRVRNIIFLKNLKNKQKQCKIYKNKKEKGSNMYLIVGLGNPEEKYGKTRHNMGFDTINKLAEKYNLEIKKIKFKGLYENTIIEGQKVILLKPQTYMNLSGESIKECVDFYKIDLDKILVIYDDMDVKPGTIKIRKKGSSAGHNGIKSIISELGTEEFARIRIGIGKPEEKYDKINYVIGQIPEEENKLLQEGVEKAKDAVIEILKNGIDKAMNKFN